LEGPNRTFGIAYYHLGFSESFKNIAPPFAPLRNEHGLELFYKAALTPWFQVTADLQVITPILKPIPTSLLLALRSKIDF
jgi:porin